MTLPKLWISFQYQDEEIDLWALYLDTETQRDCDIWQASGQPLEFEHTHLRGTRPETVPGFQEKWLMKDNLTETEMKIIRETADNHPVDNDGAYWDSRIFCFEILATLEIENVLSRSDRNYRNVRKRLHEKWKTDDGVSASDSDDLDSEDADEEKAPNAAQVDDSNLKAELEECNGKAREGGLGFNRFMITGQKREVSHLPIKQSTYAYEEKNSANKDVKVELGKRQELQ